MKNHWDFADQLRRYGPNATPFHGTIAEARRYCAWVARSHYENFSVISMFVPWRLVKHMEAVYAYCRWSDDLADEAANPQEAIDLLQWWRAELEQCPTGTLRHPVFVALRETMSEFQIPLEPFHALLNAFVQDQHVNRYATFIELLGYCENSANPVGQLVLYLARSATPENVRLSNYICTALQLTNFWQDVRRDWENLHRIYLPAEDRLHFGWTDDMMATKQTTPEFVKLLEFEVARTRQFFDAGQPLLRRIPREYRPMIELFIRGGRAILDRIEAQDYDVWTARPKLSKFDKFRLMLEPMWKRLTGKYW